MHICAVYTCIGVVWQGLRSQYRASNRGLLCGVACRWEQRPKSPALSWGGAEEADAAEVPPTAWLEQWDLRAEGLVELTTTSEALPQQQPPQQQNKPHDASMVQQNPQQNAEPGQDQPRQEVPQQQPAASQQHQQDSAAASSADLESVRSVMLQHAGSTTTCWCGQLVAGHTRGVYHLSGKPKVGMCWVAYPA